MKIYRLAYNVSKDDLLTSKISKEIFSIVKGQFGKNISKEIEIDKICKIYLNISYVNLSDSNYNIGGGFYFSKFDLFDPNIVINIDIFNSFSKLNFSEIYGQIFNTIKHEISHYYQYKTNRENMEIGSQDQEDGSDFLDSCIKISEYILSDIELEPYVKGLVFQSKKSNYPFATLLNDNLDYLFFKNKNKNNIINSDFGHKINEMINRIKLTVTNKAKQLYPYLRSEL